jgi:DNA polymerase-3 subunit alpha
MSYVPTHLHSCYSVRDAVIKIDQLADKCIELGIESCAITDHGFIGASYKQFKIFKERNIKPIIGCEFYFTENAEEKEAHFHLVLIAKNQEGFKNLNRLSKFSYVTGFYRKPRIDWKSLEMYSEGLICSTACIFGLPQQLILNNEVDASIGIINKLKKIFGEDFYLEIADHNLADEVIVKDFFRNTGADLGIKILPATDSHYLNPGDKEFHNIFKQLAYNTVGKGDDGFDGKDYHVWSLAEMQAKFTPEEISNTLEIADKCDVKFEFTGYHLPEAETPSGMDEFTYLYDLALKGLKRVGKDADPIYIERVRFEMEQLHLTELEHYFLVVYDYVLWSKMNNIPVGPGRGSAAGSLVSYLIGITGVDPIQYDLLFARCINPGRAMLFDFGV